jgi:hypothetical protein
MDKVKEREKLVQFFSGFRRTTALAPQVGHFPPIGATLRAHAGR